MKKEIAFPKARKLYDETRVNNSMVNELAGLISKWHPVDYLSLSQSQRRGILPGQGLIRSKPKVDDENFLKGRFVAGGHRQNIESYDIYREVTAPTASLSSLFSVAAYGASKDLASFDIKMAFTQAPMPKNGRKIHIRLTKPYVDLIKSINSELKSEYERFQKEDGSVIVELDFALYGCIEAGRLFYDYFKNILVTKMGYSVSLHDNCVFNLFDDKSVIISTIVIHVDDGFVTANSENALDYFCF